MHQPSSKALAAKIVSNRILGSFKKESREAMIELMKRKENGDLFNFEEYIENKVKEINSNKPELNNDITKLLSTLSKMKYF